jgi:hypothetical protein
MTSLEPLEKTVDMDMKYLNDLLVQAIESGKLSEALTLAIQGKETAKENSLPKWVNQFEEVHQEILVAMNVKQEENNQNIIDDSCKRVDLKEESESLSPYKMLLKRDDTNSLISSNKSFNPSEESQPNENFHITNEIEPVYEDNANEVVEEDKEDDEDSLMEELIPKKASSSSWFDSRYQYSRLTGSYPPRTSQNKSQEESIDRPRIMYEDYKELEHENILEKDNDNLHYHKEEFQLNESPVIYPQNTQKIESPSQPQISNYSTPSPVLKEEIEPDFPEVKFQPISSNQVKDSKVKVAKTTLQNQKHTIIKELGEILKIQQYRLMPHQYFQEVDVLAYKILDIVDHKRLLVLLPIRIESNSDLLLITENLVAFKHSKNESISSVEEILQYRDFFHHDFNTEGKIFQFVNTYLDLKISTQKTRCQHRLYMSSGQDHYTIYIEPLLISQKQPYFMEKKIPFAYQRSTNLHVISSEQLLEFLEFLETKFIILEQHSIEKKPANLQYQQASKSFSRNLQISSLLVWLYAGLLIVMFCTQWYYLLRIFLNFGYAVVGIYSFIILYLYYRFHLVKKELLFHFHTPYYLQNLKLEEAELAMLKAEYPEDFMIQFEYECLKSFQANQSELKDIEQKFQPIPSPIEPIIPKDEIPDVKLREKYPDFF